MNDSPSEEGNVEDNNKISSSTDSKIDNSPSSWNSRKLNKMKPSSNISFTWSCSDYWGVRNSSQKAAVIANVILQDMDLLSEEEKGKEIGIMTLRSQREKKFEASEYIDLINWDGCKLGEAPVL